MNLFELANIQAPPFPALEVVHLDATGTDDAAERNSWTRYQAFLEAKTLAETIIIHAPQLKKLHFVNKGGLPICGHVLNVFHARTGAEVMGAEASESEEDEWYEF